LVERGPLLLDALSRGQMFSLQIAQLGVRWRVWKRRREEQAAASQSARANQQLKSIRICFACGSAVAASAQLRLLTARGDLRASRRLGLLVPQRHADA
jgi:hypothetical protein